MSNSRRASSPTTKKKNVIRPLFTQPCRSSETVEPPSRSESSVLQRASYEAEWTFTHVSAATVATSRTAALPVSVRRNSRSGERTLRAQAVRPEDRDALSATAAERASHEFGFESQCPR